MRTERTAPATRGAAVGFRGHLRGTNFMRLRRQTVGLQLQKLVPLRVRQEHNMHCPSLPGIAQPGHSVIAGFARFAGLRRPGVPSLVPVPALDALRRHGPDVGRQVTTRTRCGQQRTLRGPEEIPGICRVTRDAHDLLLTDILRAGGDPGLCLRRLFTGRPHFPPVVV